MFKTIILESLLVFSAITTVLSCADYCVPLNLCTNKSLTTSSNNVLCDKSEVCCPYKDLARGKAIEDLGCGHINLMGNQKLLRSTDFYKKSDNFSYPGLAPWAVQIGVSTTYFHCNGALIKPNVVLTTASCVGIKHITYYVRSGQVSYNLTTEDLFHQDRKVTKVYLHSHYNVSNHDIAVLILAKPFELSLMTNTICLPQSKSDPSDLPTPVSLYESVWDKFEYKIPPGKEISVYTLLKYQKSRTLPYSNCQKKYNANRYWMNDKFCTAWLKNETRSCIQERYLGSPLVKLNKKNGLYELWGLAVDGKGCKTGRSYRAYTFVAMYRDFISLSILSSKSLAN